MTTMTPSSESQRQRDIERSIRPFVSRVQRQLHDVLPDARIDTSNKPGYYNLEVDQTDLEVVLLALGLYRPDGAPPSQRRNNGGYRIR